VSFFSANIMPLIETVFTTNWRWRGKYYGSPLISCSSKSSFQKAFRANQQFEAAMISHCGPTSSAVILMGMVGKTPVRTPVAKLR